VSAELLRAWEQRYGLLRPERSAGGFRLYSPSDEARVRRMTSLIASGVSASEAAARATGDEPVTQEGAATDGVARELREALDRFDAGGAHQAFDRLLATVSVEIAITEVLVPLLHELGDRWETGSATIGCPMHCGCWPTAATTASPSRSTITISIRSRPICRAVWPK